MARHIQVLSNQIRDTLYIREDISLFTKGDKLVPIELTTGNKKQALDYEKVQLNELKEQKTPYDIRIGLLDLNIETGTAIGVVAVNTSYYLREISLIFLVEQLKSDILAQDIVSQIKDTSYYKEYDTLCRYKRDLHFLSTENPEDYKDGQAIIHKEKLLWIFTLFNTANNIYVNCTDVESIPFGAIYINATSETLLQVPKMIMKVGAKYTDLVFEPIIIGNQIKTMYKSFSILTLILDTEVTQANLLCNILLTVKEHLPSYVGIVEVVLTERTCELISVLSLDKYTIENTLRPTFSDLHLSIFIKKQVETEFSTGNLRLETATTILSVGVDHRLILKLYNILDTNNKCNTKLVKTILTKYNLDPEVYITEYMQRVGKFICSDITPDKDKEIVCAIREIINTAFA